jgi:hypothetical protein
MSWGSHLQCSLESPRQVHGHPASGHADKLRVPCELELSKGRVHIPMSARDIGAVADSA